MTLEPESGNGSTGDGPGGDVGPGGGVGTGPGTGLGDGAGVRLFFLLLDMISTTATMAIMSMINGIVHSLFSNIQLYRSPAAVKKLLIFFSCSSLFVLVYGISVFTDSAPAKVVSVVESSTTGAFFFTFSTGNGT